MPSQYGADALLGLTLGSNLLALPSSLEEGYQQAQRNQALVNNPDLIKALGVPPELMGSLFPTAPPMGAQTLHQGLQVPVLGSLLRGVGTAGQLLQTVLGNREAAPRPPLAELAQLAQIRKAGEAEDRDKQRLDMERQRLGIEQRTANSRITHQRWEESGNKKSFVLGGGASPSGVPDSGGGVWTEQGIPDSGGVRVEGGMTAQDVVGYKREFAKKVARGEMTQQDADAQLFGLRQAMQPREDTTSAGSSMPASAATKPGAGSIRYGHDFFQQKVSPAVALQFGALGLDPENFTPADLQKAQQAALKQDVHKKVAETRATAGFKSQQEVQKQLGSIRITRSELSDAKEKIASVLTTNPLIARSTQPIAVALQAALQSTDPKTREAAIAARQLMLWAPQLAKAHGLTARFNQTEFNMYAGAIDPTKMTAPEFLASIDNMLHSLDVAEQQANQIGGGAPPAPAPSPMQDGTTAAPSPVPADAASGPGSQDWHQMLDTLGVPR